MADEFTVDQPSFPDSESSRISELRNRILRLETERDKIEDEVNVLLVDNIEGYAQAKEEYSELHSASLVVTGIIYNPEDEEYAFEKYPQLQIFVDNNEEIVDSIKQVQSDLTTLRTELLSIYFEEEQKITRDIMDHFDWNVFFSHDTDSNIIVTGYLALEEISRHLNRQNEDNTSLSPAQKEWFARSKQSALERLRKAHRAVSNTGLLLEEETHYDQYLSADLDIDEARNIFSNVDDVSQKIDTIHEVERLILPHSRHKYIYNDLTHICAGYRTDEYGVPVTLSENEEITRLVARKLANERKSARVDSYFPETPVSQESIDKNKEYLENICQQMAQWIDLSNKYKGEIYTSNLVSEYGFMSLAYDYRQHPYID